MIGKVSQTMTPTLQTVQRDTVARATPTALSDTFIRSAAKADLWSYSVHEVKSDVRMSKRQAPDWRITPTKGMHALSEEQLLSEMKAVATRQAQLKMSSARDAQWEREWDEVMDAYVKLRAYAISEVSPDRKALFAQAEKAIRQHQEDEEHVYPLTLTLVDYMCDFKHLEGKMTTSAGNAIVSTTHTTGYGTDYDVHFGGERVLATSRGEWTYFLTQAESRQLAKFQATFERFYEGELAAIAKVK